MLYCTCLVAVVITSCSDNVVQTDPIVNDHETHLRELISKYPDSLLLKENLVQYFRDNGDYHQALAETDNVLKKDSLNARFLDMKGTLHFEKGDTMNAIRAFEKAVSIKQVPEYIISLGSLYAQTKNPLALKVGDELLHLPLVDAQKKGYFIKGLFFSYTGDKIKAIAFFNTCLKIDYRDLLAYREKAICLYDLGKYSTALDELEKAVAVKKTFDEGYYWMGRCYEKLDKGKEAIDNYQLALQIDPDYKEAKDALQKMETR
ncbi:MAG: tetratricopeptide repeat protein [Ferruginibacter sp.]